MKYVKVQGSGCQKGECNAKIIWPSKKELCKKDDFDND